jgi:hypothetical protein
MTRKDSFDLMHVYEALEGAHRAARQMHGLAAGRAFQVKKAARFKHLLLAHIKNENA